MRRAGAGLLSVGACLIAIGCCAPSAIGAPAPRGQLTAQEFTLLSGAQSALKKALSGSRPNWGSARTACLSIGGSTTLLARQSQDCLGSLTLELALANFPAAEHSCPKAENQKIVCMAPLYRAMAQYATSAYALDVKTRESMVARGFAGACLAVLASTPKQLGNEHELATSTNKLASDMALMVNIIAGEAPPSKLDQTRVDADVNVFEHYANLVLSAGSPDDLAACPHESA